MSGEDNDTFPACRKCNKEFVKPTKKGKVKFKGGKITIVVDGYCFDCCMIKGEYAIKEFNQVLEGHPEIQEAFKKYLYLIGLQTTAIILD